MNGRAVMGFVGVGRMGGPMASRLLDAGHALHVFDTSADALAPLVARGAVRAASPAEVAAHADTVLMSLPTPDIVHAVVFGEAGLVQGSRLTTLIDLSTTGPAMARTVAQGLAAHGVTPVDAPVSGGVAGARNGTLAVMVSCPHETFRDVSPLLENFGRLFHVGEAPGLGQTAKLVNNLLNAAALAVSAEAMAMGVKAGIDAATLLEVVNAGSGRNSATQDKFPRAVLPGTFDFGFAIGLLHKDVRLCLEEAESMGVPMVVGAAIRQLLAITSVQFGPAADFTTVAKVVEQWSGVEIRARS